MIKESLKKHNFLFGVLNNTLRMCFLFSDEENIDCKVVDFVIKPIGIQEGKFQFKLIEISSENLDHLYDWLIWGKKDVWLEPDNGEEEAGSSAECWFFHNAEIDSNSNWFPIEVGQTYIMNYEMLECLK